MQGAGGREFWIEGKQMNSGKGEGLVCWKTRRMVWDWGEGLNGHGHAIRREAPVKACQL